MIKTWFKRNKEVLMIPTSYKNTAISLEMYNRRGVRARFFVKTSDNITLSQATDAISYGSLNATLPALPVGTGRTYYIELTGNSKFKDIEVLLSPHSRQMFYNVFSKQILESFPNLKRWEQNVNNVTDSSANVQKYSGENFATLNLPFLETFKHRDHSNISNPNRMLLNFNSYGLLPELKLLSWAAIYSAVIVTGEAKYLPRKLKIISDEGYTTPSGFTGKFSDLPDGLEFVYVSHSTSQNLIGYTSKTWTGILSSLIIARVGLTSSELDALLIDLANATWRQGTGKQINITQRVAGGIGVRTSASDNAVNILKSQGISIQISNNTF